MYKINEAEHYNYMYNMLHTLFLVLILFFFTEITCPIPEIMKGSVSSTTLPKFQESMTVSCDAGYRVNGSATITCQDDRSFGTLPNCIGQFQ